METKLPKEEYSRPPVDLREPRTREHSEDEKENIALLISRREEFLEKNVQTVAEKRATNTQTIADLEKAIEGNNLIIENLKKQKMEALDNAMQTQEKSLTISKPRIFEKFTRFISDRINPGRTIQAKVLHPFKASIDSCESKGETSTGKTEEEEQNEFSAKVKSTIEAMQEKYAMPVGKIHAFINAAEKAVKKVQALGIKEESDKGVIKGFDEEIII